MTKSKSSNLTAVWHFYRDGFKNMTLGRTLWLIILVKLVIMFAVLRVFFFKPAMAGKTDAEKINTVGEHLTSGIKK